MTSSRPYLLRAIHQWIEDNQLVPYILVNALADGVEVPPQYINNGKIILNVSHNAVINLELSNDAVSFQARFSGQPVAIHVPLAAVMAIYAKENGRGMVFSDDGDNDEPPPDGEKKKVAPRLRVVK
jgi:stringent starvation protein B